MRTYNLTFAAGETKTLPGGVYVELLETEAPVDVEFFKDNQPVTGVSTGIEDVYTWGGFEFHSMKITSATAQSIKLGIGNDSYGKSSKVGGTITVTGDGGTSGEAVVITNENISGHIYPIHISNDMDDTTGVRTPILVDTDPNDPLHVDMDIPGNSCDEPNYIRSCAGFPIEVTDVSATGVSSNVWSATYTQNVFSGGDKLLSNITSTDSSKRVFITEIYVSTTAGIAINFCSGAAFHGNTHNVSTIVPLTGPASAPVNSAVSIKHGYHPDSFTVPRGTVQLAVYNDPSVDSYTKLPVPTFELVYATLCIDAVGRSNTTITLRGYQEDA